MMRNRSSPQTPDASGASNSPDNYDKMKPQPLYSPSPHHYQQQPRGGGTKMSALVLIICCLCCIILIAMAGALAFAINTGAIQFNMKLSNSELATGDAINSIHQRLRQPTSPDEPPTGSTPDGQVKAQMADQAKLAAQEHHEKDQQFVELAHKKAVIQTGKANPNFHVNPNNIPNIVNPVGGLKGVVKDRDGDVVTDDMLAKDIAAGHDVDAAIQNPDTEETDVAIGDNRWDHTEHIPQWLKDYFKWHNEVTATLVKPNWHDQQYLVMTCLGGEICGNVAHRLRPLMAMLRVAADSKRIFYIHWDLPDRLEKYLAPRQRGGIDWVVPDFVMWKVRKSAHQNNIDIIHQQAFQDDRRVVNTMFNDDSFAEPYYDERLQPGESDAQAAFHEVWNVLFKPSFMLEERLHESLHLMGLTAGEYATAHIDFEIVPKDEEEKEYLRMVVENAMNCMSNLRPGGPYLVAAQTYAIAREAIVYGKHHGVHVHAKQIAHDTSTVPTDLYTSFVEIMLMANSKCVAYNRGGYGQLGYMLGWDYDCKILYAPPKKCQWTAGPGAALA